MTNPLDKIKARVDAALGGAYPEQNPIALGNHYTRHVQAMTAEGLHSKAEIAEQLAWRDALIQDLWALVQEQQGEIERLNEKCVDIAIDGGAV